MSTSDSKNLSAGAAEGMFDPPAVLLTTDLTDFLNQDEGQDNEALFSTENTSAALSDLDDFLEHARGIFLQLVLRDKKKDGEQRSDSNKSAVAEDLLKEFLLQVDQTRSSLLLATPATSQVIQGDSHYANQTLYDEKIAVSRIRSNRKNASSLESAKQTSGVTHGEIGRCSNKESESTTLSRKRDLVGRKVRSTTPAGKDVSIGHNSSRLQNLTSHVQMPSSSSPEIAISSGNIISEKLRLHSMRPTRNGNSCAESSDEIPISDTSKTLITNQDHVDTRLILQGKRCIAGLLARDLERSEIGTADSEMAMLPVPDTLQRQRGVHARGSEEPGVVRVPGNTSERPGSIQIGSSTFHNNGSSPVSREMLVHALVVDDKPSNPTGIIATARPDPWWRRHQWWLAGGTVVLVVALILAVVFTTVDFGIRNDEPVSSAPTTFVEGIEEQTRQLIVSILPDANALLSNKSLPQYKSLQWVVKQQANNDGLYAESRILRYYSLASFFYSTNDNLTWYRSDGWLHSADECEWYGIECGPREDSGDTSILGLNLTNNGLYGALTSDLALLSDTLLLLDLSYNDIEGSIPYEIGWLTSLTYLSLADNHLAEGIPASVGGMTDLLHMDLKMNLFRSAIPSEVGRMKKLQYLLLQDNDLSGALPAQIGHLCSLQHLYVANNRLTFQIPNELGQLLNLEALIAHNNSFLGSLPSRLWLLRNLQSLDLSNNFLFERIPSELRKLGNLSYLDLSYNLLTGAVPTTIGLLQRLSTLRLNDNFLDGNIPYTIGSVNGLVHLDLSSNFLTGLIPGELWQLSKMKNLKLSSNKLLGQIRMAPLHGSSLDNIDLSSNQISSKLPTEIGLWTSLTSLNFSHNNFYGRIPFEFGSLSNLTSLDTSFNDLNEALPSEIWGLTRLEVLNLAFNDMNVTLNPDYLSMLTNLRGLQLASNRVVGIIPTQIGLLTRLESVSLYGNNLSGSIPSEVGSLSNMLTFKIGQNQLTGPLPTEIFTLSQLKVLHLSDNFFSGSIPAQIGILSHLCWLSLAINNFSSYIPTELGLLSHLEKLDLSENYLLSGTIPSELSSLTRLHAILLHDNVFTGSISSEIGKLIEMRQFSVGGNQLNNTIPTEFGLLTDLCEFDLAVNSLSGKIPSQLGQLTLLESVVLSNNLLSGSVPSELGKLVEMQELLLSNNLYLSGAVPTQIGNASNLQTLVMSNNQLTSVIPSEVGLLQALSSFRLSENLLTGSLPSQMGLLTNLFTADLSSNPLSGLIPIELGLASNLLVFDIANTNITGSIPLCNNWINVIYDLPGYDDFNINVDCESVSCACCFCPFPTSAPSGSIFPTKTPSTKWPSNSISPMQGSLVSFNPSAIPSTAPTCSAFSSIAPFGLQLSISGTDEGVDVVNIPFMFPWRGANNNGYFNAVVSPNGVVFLGTKTTCERCWLPDPIQLDGNYTSPRIAVAQSNLNSQWGGFIFTAMVGNAFVVSWEGVPQYDFDIDTVDCEIYDACPPNGLHFQVAFYPTGKIEMRWGKGSEFVTAVAAGVLDDATDVAVPVTGFPFATGGVSYRWPSNQCRSFVALSGTYFEM